MLTRDEVFRWIENEICQVLDVFCGFEGFITASPLLGGSGLRMIITCGVPVKRQTAQSVNLGFTMIICLLLNLIRPSCSQNSEKTVEIRIELLLDGYYNVAKEKEIVAAGETATTGSTINGEPYNYFAAGDLSRPHLCS